MTGQRENSKAANPLVAWLQLVRLPNVFTVLADVGAAFLLVAGGAMPPGRFALILASGVALYWAGMVLNDVFDIEKDKAERSSRPLASGAISVRAASTAGWALLVIGVALAAASGYVPGGPATWLPAVVGVALAVLVVAYDGPLKPTAMAPVAMGGCRILSFLLGASPVIPVSDGLPEVPRYVLGIACGFGVYVMGITTFARDEAKGSRMVNLRTGFIVMVVGVALLAVAPTLASLTERQGWALPIGPPFYALIGMIAMPVAVRGFRVQWDPDPAQIGNTIRAAILSIIPFAAAFATLGAGPAWGLTVFALIVPAIGLSMKLRVT